MRILRVVCIVLSFWVLTSCNDHYLSLPVKEIRFKNLTDTLVHGYETDVQVMGAKSIVVCDTFLVVLTNDVQGYLKIYSTESLDYLGTFGAQGRAGNEFNKPSFLENPYMDGADVILPLLDNRILRKDVNISRSLKEGIAVINSSERIMNSGIGNSFDLKNDKQFVCYSYKISAPESQPPTYCLKNGDQETEIMVFPKMVRAEEDHVGLLGYASHIYRHPYKDIFVEAFNLRDYLLYFDFEKDSHYAVHQKGALSFDDYYDENAFSEGDEQVNYFWSGVCTDNFIMFLYGAGDYCIKSKDYKSSVTPQEVLVFDWSGNYLCGIKLDVRVQKITYDQKHKVLYGLNDSNESIYGFNLSRYNIGKK